MIDARNYKTRDELSDAMQFEHDISQLDYLNRTLAELELSFEIYKHRHEILIEEIKIEQQKLRNNIDEYHKKLRLKKK